MSTKPSSGCVECGVVSGLIVTAALNPWDRALYLSIINDRPFLRLQNFRQPYQGLGQTLVARALSSGMYFPLEDFFTCRTGSAAFGGQLAGVSIGLVLNPLSLIKYQIWAEERRNFFKQAQHMHRQAGIFIFTRGVFATCMRDSVFGFVFASRKMVATDCDGTTRFLVSLIAAGSATIFSSPFNYLRNMVYAIKAEDPLETMGLRFAYVKKVFHELAQGANKEATTLASLRFLQRRLMIGWGTFRVAFGMASIDQIYSLCNKAYNS